MKPWDLTSGAARLDDAMQSLQIAFGEAKDHWDDRTRQQFETDYLEPLAPRLNRALEAIRLLAEVFAQAEQQCGDQS